MLFQFSFHWGTLNRFSEPFILFFRSGRGQGWKGFVLLTFCSMAKRHRWCKDIAIWCLFSLLTPSLTLWVAGPDSLPRLLPTPHIQQVGSNSAASDPAETKAISINWQSGKIQNLPIRGIPVNLIYQSRLGKSSFIQDFYVQRQIFSLWALCVRVKPQLV